MNFWENIVSGARSFAEGVCSCVVKTVEFVRQAIVKTAQAVIEVAKVVGCILLAFIVFHRDYYDDYRYSSGL